MKIFFTGLNLYRQFPNDEFLIENFYNYTVKDLTNIEVNYNFLVSVIAEKLNISGRFSDQIKDSQINGVSQAVCNDQKILVLTNDGQLLQITDCNPPTQINIADEKFRKISCGAKLSVCLSTRGNLYNMPNKLEFEAKDIVDVKTGREHCLLLDCHGRVFSFGRGSRGQLGHSSLEDEIEPKLVEALAGIKINAISAGGWHSCALSAEGDLYTWGWNGSEQLGLNNAAGVMACPHLVDFDQNVLKVASGNKHTVALLDDGKLYGCGWNKYKQLLSSKEEIHKMTYLWDFSKEAVVDIKCGPWNTIVLCS